jgi:hypothetical protein
MSAGFLGDLANSISSQYNLSGNNTTSMNAIIDGQQGQASSLGNFAAQLNQSNEIRYVEEGYLRRDPYETDPKSSNVLWQEPTATVLVKKRMFSSIAENYRPDFMDADEKLYYKAMRVLFQNKCSQIGALEQLGKIQKMTAAVGSISNQLVPIIITLTDIANNGYGNGGNAFGLLNGNANPFTTQDGSAFMQVVNRLRVLFAYNQTAPYTTWITDPTNLYQSTFATGTGVIEITNFTSINTSTTVNMITPGNFQFSISDPYQAMLITDYDIEIALSDATNLFYNNKAFQFGVASANQVISNLQTQLNSIRNARGAGSITFNTSPTTILNIQPITAIINQTGLEIPFTYSPLNDLAIPGLGGSGNSVQVPADYLMGGAIAGYSGLATTVAPIGPDNNIKSLVKNSELSIFQSIITAMFSQLQLLANSSNNFTSYNQFPTNYARKKLRFAFSGKLIVQPMDVVHIYMGSKSQFDNKILTGLTQMFSGFGILQNPTNTLNALTNSYDTLFNPSGNIAIQAEKSIYAGPNFPNYLWALLRPQFVTEIEGTHVFGGVVESAVDNWSDGKFTIEVSGKDNTYYFEQGKINFKPGVDAFNGLIFDPLTPFESNFDNLSVNNAPLKGTPTLLSENVFLLSQSGQQSLVKHKWGALAGEKATQSNYIQDSNIDPTTGRLTKIFYAPDGLVYKWKQGIGIFTQSGSSSTINAPQLVGDPTIFNEPFAGLDVMNVLSLLIAGVPYNYATYFKATSNFYGFAGDPQSKQSPAHSYMDSLRASLAQNNTLWGNFVPFKLLTQSEGAIAQSMQGQSKVNALDADLNNKLKQFAQLQSAVVTLGAVNVLSTKINAPQSTGIYSQLTNLQAQVDTLQSSIQGSIASLNNATAQLTNQIGNTASYESSNITDGKNDPTDTKARQLLRKQINYLTRRMSYDVRANEDKNLFIVDDYYDTDYDIAAFNQSIADAGGIKLFSNEFTDVRSKIMNVADLLNLEIFCDSQGHIRARSPQYNRMPSSVFYRMLYLKQTIGIQIFPQFLNNLFTNQLDSLRTQIEVIEDMIRLNTAIIGQYPSLSAYGDIIAQNWIAGQNVVDGQGATFSFISSYTDTITDINNLLQQANQDIANSSTSQNLADYSAIKAAGTSTKQLFGNAQKYTVLFEALQAQNQVQDGLNTDNIPTTSIFQSSVVQQLITRINTKSGQTITSADYLTSQGSGQPLEVNTSQTIDLFKVTDNLAIYIGQWQNAVKAFYHTLKNTAEYKSIDNNSVSANALQNPGLFNNSYIPEVYEHMIEDETYDDYGLNSGTRFIIKNSQIKNLSIAENPPPYTTVEVHGTLQPFQENFGPPGLVNFPGGGNGLVTALAIDYDMWRNYGFKQPSVISVPFLDNPDTQLGPYAAMILARNRYNILRGTCTISGNEYMQVGEVVYLEDRNLLFYVNSVKHNMVQGSTFTTTLDLTYGHSIGDYIPTYIDTVGKLFFVNQNNDNFIIQRQGTSAKEQSMGTVQLSGQQPMAPVLATGSESDTVNPYSASNQTVITNLLYNTAYIINANQTAGNNIQAAIELRIYFDNNTEANENLTNAAELVLNALNGGSQGPQTNYTKNQPTPNSTIPSKWISIVPVNIDSDTDRRSPSQQAIDAARNQLANTSTNMGSPSSSNPIDGNTNSNVATINASNLSLRTALFSYIIDCWVTFTEIPATISSSSTADPGY